ncbi:hypothetical protein G7Y79_00062g093430 [Physcia stellaris]|nr:hypothetical protein G7Y79_00062g093430 [Physcia stellaris]
MDSTHMCGSAKIKSSLPTKSTKDERGDEVPDLATLSLDQKCEEDSASQSKSNTVEISAKDDLSSGKSKDIDPASAVESEDSQDEENSDSASEDDAEYDSDDSNEFNADDFEYDSDGDIIFELDLSEDKKKKADEAARKQFLKQHLTPIELFIHSLPSVEVKDLPEGDRACGICGINYEEGEAPDFAVRLPCSHLIGKECLRGMLAPEEEGGSGKTSCYRCRQPMAIPEK